TRAARRRFAHIHGSTIAAFRVGFVVFRRTLFLYMHLHLYQVSETLAQTNTESRLDASTSILINQALRRIKMNPPVPGFLFPFMLYGTLATLAALFLGLSRSLKIANWSTQDRGKAIWAAAALITVFYLAALLPSRSSFYARSATSIPTIQYGILSPSV